MATRTIKLGQVRRLPTNCWTLLCMEMLALLLVSIQYTSACDVPVFRYALERWTSDEYQLIVYHEGELSKSSQQKLTVLEGLIDAEKTGAVGSKRSNLKIVLIDLTQSRNEDEYQGQLKYWRETLQKSHSTKLPFAVLRTGGIAGYNLELWQGPLEQFQVDSWMASPVRNELCKRLMRGDAIVWMLVKSNQADRNISVRKLLQEKSRELSHLLELPEGIGSPGSELYSEVPLLLEFSVLEVSRDDRNESYLIDLVSKLDPQAFADDEPLVVPVFGRGRALEVIPGSGLDSGMVGDLARFLSGACSCQVKERNPGFDLLIQFNWHRELFQGGAVPPPPDEGLKATRPLPKLLEIPSGRKRLPEGR